MNYYPVRFVAGKGGRPVAFVRRSWVENFIPYAPLKEADGRGWVILPDRDSQEVKPGETWLGAISKVPRPGLIFFVPKRKLVGFTEPELNGRQVLIPEISQLFRVSGSEIRIGEGPHRVLHSNLDEVMGSLQFYESLPAPAIHVRSGWWLVDVPPITEVRWIWIKGRILCEFYYPQRGMFIVLNGREVRLKEQWPLIRVNGTGKGLLVGIGGKAARLIAKVEVGK